MGIRIKKSILTFLLSSLVVLSIMYIRTLYLFPENLMITQGKEFIYEFNAPLTVDVSTDSKDIIVNGERINDYNYKVNLKSPFKIQSEKPGKANLRFILFGSIPLKTVTVNIMPETMVVPCGNTIGVRIHTKGVLVVGTSSVSGIDGKDYKPYKEAGIEVGDLITGIDDVKISKVKDLSTLINKSNGKTVQVSIERNNGAVTTRVTPVKSMEDKKYKIGLWVRDGTAGIGTLTFYEPKTGMFGALGHGITDSDTGNIMKVNNGDILESSIIAVKKGRRGDPGELKGIFLNEDFKRGTIYENTEKGIFGRLTDSKELIRNSPVPVGLRSEIKEGPATILSNIDGRRVESFTIEIVKVMRYSAANSKNMIIKITDPKLLAATGGIVQGMSGSPIIQNGKLVGAVTHVFVNDPTKGYGIFADLMVQSAIQAR